MSGCQDVRTPGCQDVRTSGREVRERKSEDLGAGRVALVSRSEVVGAHCRRTRRWMGAKDDELDVESMNGVLRLRSMSG